MINYLFQINNNIYLNFINQFITYGSGFDLGYQSVKFNKLNLCLTIKLLTITIARDKFSIKNIGNQNLNQEFHQNSHPKFDQNFGKIFFLWNIICPVLRGYFYT